MVFVKSCTSVFLNYVSAFHEMLLEVILRVLLKVDYVFCIINYYLNNPQVDYAQLTFILHNKFVCIYFLTNH